MKKVFQTIVLLLFISSAVYAQEFTITGKVSSAEDASPIPGVSVLVEGTTTGTITSIDGDYTLTAKKGDVLSFSFIGMKSQLITVGAETVINIILQLDVSEVDEVVVVGYGVQKKSVVTAAITKVDAKSLETTAPYRVDDALKGLAAGVSVTSGSGQPGDAPVVRIRGVGTINDSDPLYIVDGMIIEGGIDYINPSDILSVEVLKDAASGAVYGARAANGVILITTKNGQQGKLSVDYNFSIGFQNPWRQRDVLNATEYATMMNEGYINAGGGPKYDDPYSYGDGTNWQDLVYNDNAPVINHQVSLNGGSEKVLYYLSAGYNKQEGIIGGNWDRSNYNRLSLRSNLTFNLLNDETRNYLNTFKMGMNVGYSRTKSMGIDTNSEYGSVLGSALAFSPLLGLYEEDPESSIEYYEEEKGYSLVRDPNNGLLYTIATSDYNEITNPVAKLSLPGDVGYSDKIVSNFWAEIGIWNNLKFRTSFGADLSYWGSDGWTPAYYLGPTTLSLDSKVWSSMEHSLVWQLENTLSYNKTVGKHSFSLLLGQSAKETTGRYLGGSNKYMVEEDGDKANIDFTTGTSTEGTQTVYGSAYSPYTMASLFGRISYNYNEKYMIQATVRRDGSSNFGSNNRYAIFPSVSLGWNITRENFMENRPEWLKSAKLRASWGKNGNDQIGSFAYVSLTSTGNNYTFGSGDGTTYNGTKPSGLANPDLKWEESEQTDIGLDLGLFNNQLTFTVDYYDKKTNGMLMTMSIPSYVGEAKPTGNVGDMDNSGWEFEANYKLKINRININLGANCAYLKNKLIELGNSEGYQEYDSYQTVGTISKGQNGYPFPFFYGKKTNGIFQNVEEINSYVNEDGELIQPDALPGDVRFIDLDGSGEIDDNDKTMIGKGMPDWTYGFNLGLDWKGFDFNIMLQGTIGSQIFDATRRTDLAYINLPRYMLNSWTGEGTSNKYPRFTFPGDQSNGNWESSDLFVKDGDYMRVRNVTLGYTIPVSLTQKVFVNKFRIYASASNLFTFTKYDGCDPETSSGGTSLGIDRGVYPQARTYTFGLNLTF